MLARSCLAGGHRLTNERRKLTPPEPYYDSDGITIYCGDNVAALGGLEADSIDLTVTSPPYDNLREYGGHSWDFEGVAQQLWRVTKPGGVVVWVVADATIDGSETGTSFRQALHFKDIGFRLETMIFEKQSFMQPTENVPRYYQLAEFMFVLSNGKPKAFNPIIDVENTQAGKTKRLFGNNSAFSGLGEGKTIEIATHRRRSNVWRYLTGHQHSTGDSCAFNHPAIFPEALARDHILSWSNEGDTVLDPFNGSGTTTKMAKHMNRQAIGIEIEERYCEIAANRLRQGVLTFT